MPKLTAPQIAAMSKEERDEANLSKSPSNQVVRAICPAKVRNGDRKGEKCTWTAGQGTNHLGFGYCAKHGGNTPAGKKAAARAYGRQLILDQKERFGGDRTSPYVSNITAEAALLEEVRRSVAMVRWLEEKIGDWELDDATNDLSSSSELGLPRLVEETTKGAPGVTDVQAWLLLYREERKHAAQVAKMCIDANISKRMVDIAQSQGQALMNVVQAVLKALDLTEVQIERVPQVVPQVIREATWQLETRQNASARSRTGANDEAVQITDLPGRTPYNA
jgi:hypothetical protein